MVDYRPQFVVIADDLRERIRSGDLAPGSRVPGQNELSAQYGCATATARRGLAVLQAEGLTEPIRGRGVFVREHPPVITVRGDRFSAAARAAGKGALAAEAESQGLSWESEELAPVEVVDLPPRIAEVLGEPRAAVKRRRMWVGGIPTQLADSYVPESLDREIGYSTGATAPGGIYGLIEQHGHHIARYREELAARIAAPEESVDLQLPTGAAVVEVVRHAIDDNGRVVEYFDSVAVADSHRYVYEWASTD